MKVPLSNFTVLYINYAEPIFLDGSNLVASTTDGSYVYYGATSMVYRLSISNFTVGPPLAITGVGLAFQGAFADVERNFVYFFSPDSALVRVC